MSRITFEVNSLRAIPCPHGRDRDVRNPQRTYIAICHVKNLPDTIPMSTNPRLQNLNTRVANQIERSLLSDVDENFHLLNRGILISADQLRFNNANNKLTLTFTDLEKHGNIDGGHTYQIIRRNKGDIEANQYVRLEIMTGVEDVFESLAGARNTSNQVQDKSLAELRNHFDIIKEALKDTPFINNIAYKENDSERDIDIMDIIAVMSMFNIDRYDDRSHPIAAYSSKKRAVDAYLVAYGKENNPYYKMSNIAPQIFRLFDYIDEHMVSSYNDGTGGRKYGLVRGITYKGGKPFHRFMFSSPDKEPSEYESPKGFLYPIAAAFRSLITENKKTGMYQWIADPFHYFDETGRELVTRTVEQSRNMGNNPNAVGKDSNHWALLYNIVRTKYLNDTVARLHEMI